MSLLSFTSKGIYCKQGNFYIDPWQPVDYAVITHAHGDHARWGSRFYLCQHLSKPVLQLRLGADICVEGMDYGVTKMINGVRLSMHPAGHILGAAQIRLEYQGFVSVVSGDYKTVDDGISDAFELVPCNEFVTESTFGLPIYNWLSQQEIADKMKRWILDNQSQQKTSVFVGYALGKAQRLMQMLCDIAPLYVHAAIANINAVFIANGIRLPEAKVLHEEEQKENIAGNIVIVPPALIDTQPLKKIPNAAVAVCSGWMQVRGRRRWQSLDAGFAISDHADWKGLLDTVKATGAEKVFVTHGYTAVFSKYLNEIGIHASEVNTQFGQEEEVTDIKNSRH